MKLRKEKVAKILIYIFYTVGVFGFLMPEFLSFFKHLIPLALILSFILLAVFQPKEAVDRSFIIVFGSIYLSGLIIEIIGVNTGVVFGEYSYGSNLGFKLFNTPIIIGLNWLILVYTSSALFERLNINSIYKVLLASICMLGYDIVLEKIAPKIGMWNWNGVEAPLRNFLAWFIISFIFQVVIKVVGIRVENPVAKNLFISQFIFFLILSIFLH